MKVLRVNYISKDKKTNITKEFILDNVPKNQIEWLNKMDKIAYDNEEKGFDVMGYKVIDKEEE